MRIPGERAGKTLIPKLEKILSRGPKTTNQIIESIHRRWPNWKFKPPVTRITSILRKNPKFTKLAMVENPKPSNRLILWCLTRRAERERKAIVKEIFDRIN